MSKVLTTIEGANSGKGQFLVYEAEDGRVKIDVRLEDETVWLTQQLMADRFQTTKQKIGQHLKNIFSEGELLEDSVVKKFFTTAMDGKKYKTNFYNLDAIISVGYRVKSHVATRFRIWATQRLREYIIKGFVMDDERLKNPDHPFDYFDELIRLIQDIRTSERRFYQKITDIYATSIDFVLICDFAGVLERLFRIRRPLAQSQMIVKLLQMDFNCENRRLVHFEGINEYWRED